MKKYSSLLLIILLSCVHLFSQKIAIDNNAYDGWKSLSAQIISEDGKWITYTINPQQGDGWLYIYNVSASELDSVARGGKAVFSPDTRFMVYQIIPSYDETRQGKKKKLKEDKMPKNNLEIRLLSNDEVINIPKVKSFSVAEKNSFWMAYLLEKKPVEDKNTKIPADTAKKSFSAGKKPKTPEPKGSELVIYNPILKKEFRFPDVTEYSLAKDGKSISFLQSLPDTTKIENLKLNVFDTQKEIPVLIFEGKGSLKKLSSDRTGSSVSFVYSSDTSKIKIYDLWLSRNFAAASKIIDQSDSALPHDWTPGENGNITFSDDGTKLFFGTAKKPVKQPEDTLLEEEKFKLDIWSWEDDILQPMQKKQLDEENKRTFMAVYSLNTNKMFQLADTVIPNVRTYQKGNNVLALGSSDLRYRRSSSWDGGSSSDYFLINLNTGVKTQILEKCSSRATMSPSCKYLLYWDNTDKDWFSVALPGGTKKNITSSIKVPLYDEFNDMPDDPSPHGIAGYIDDEKHVLIYDRYDIWSVDLSGSESPVNVTNNFGRKNSIRLRYVKLDQDDDFISRKDLIYLSAFNYSSKESGFYSLKQGKPGDPLAILMEKASFPSGFSKSKKTDMIIWQKGTFKDSPELYVSNLKFENPKKISATNPHQSNFNWGSSELVEWMSFDREKLQGILYKPENFDPAKKYPMIVYFYERSSDELYSYIAPVPSASRINIPTAISNGYLVFVPDITYKTGYPGQSCYNSVVSGTYALLDRFSFIDKDKLGLDGQSWGGYQIAWLVTQTDLFACAYAGAAVVNMTSAYGGIRWESGMSRMFQYEHTQSRIGGTLWEKPVQYIENSPIFFVPKINTPLLLMNNDADGAVPWYQGIEFITALRRLDKPAWMLSYNDEAHNLLKRPNRKDISIRKMQFFDHYLKDAPMPYWMKNGISQTEKGKINGYELVND